VANLRFANIYRCLEDIDKFETQVYEWRQSAGNNAEVAVGSVNPTAHH
jgi:transcriptional regulator NrdR family protein